MPSSPAEARSGTAKAIEESQEKSGNLRMAPREWARTIDLTGNNRLLCR